MYPLVWMCVNVRVNKRCLYEQGSRKALYKNHSIYRYLDCMNTGCPYKDRVFHVVVVSHCSSWLQVCFHKLQAWYDQPQLVQSGSCFWNICFPMGLGECIISYVHQGAVLEVAPLWVDAELRLWSWKSWLCSSIRSECIRCDLSCIQSAAFVCIGSVEFNVMWMQPIPMSRNLVCWRKRASQQIGFRVCYLSICFRI